MRTMPQHPVPQHPGPSAGSSRLDPYTLIGMARVGDATISPDGALAVFSVKQYDW